MSFKTLLRAKNNRFACVFAWLLFWVAVPFNAQASLIQERAWLDDPTATLSFEQVQQLTPKPYGGVLSRGFGPGAVWIRLRIKGANGSPASNEPLVLSIRPAYLNDIQVYDALTPDGLVGVTGDRYHPKNELIRGTDFIVPISPNAQPRDLWIRLTSTSTRQISVNVTPLSTLQSTRITYEVLSSLCIAILAMLFVWSLVFSFVRRDSLIGAFALKEAGALLISITAFGYARVYWPSLWPAVALDQLGSFASVFSVVGAIAFHTRLLKDYDLPRWSWWLLIAILAVCLTNLGLLLLGQTRIALTSNMFVALVAPFLVLIVALTARIWKRNPQNIPLSILPRWVILSFYSSIVLILTISSAAALAIAQAYEWTMYMGLIHGLMSGLMVMVMLQFRNYRIAQEQEESKLELQRSNLEANYQRQRRQEQEQLLQMLAHEIKTPLATIQLRLNPQSNPDIPVVLRQLNSVIDRCLQAQRTDEDSIVVQPQEVDLVDLLHDAIQSCPHPKRVDLQVGALPTLQTDRQLFYIVLSNLLDNACKYAKVEGAIEIKASFEPTTSAFTLTFSNEVGDAGWPDPDKVFEKFYRSPHAHRQAGTGLGLHIVRNVLAKLGGSIVYSPTPNLVTFAVNLPKNAWH